MDFHAGMLKLKVFTVVTKKDGSEDKDFETYAEAAAFAKAAAKKKGVVCTIRRGIKLHTLCHGCWGWIPLENEGFCSSC